MLCACFALDSSAGRKPESSLQDYQELVSIQDGLSHPRGISANELVKLCASTPTALPVEQEYERVV